MGQPPDTEPLVGNHPNILYPERFRYYSVGDIPQYNPRSWRLTVDGEGLSSSLKLRFNDVSAFTNVAFRSTFRCVNGWRVRNNVWRGVRVRDIIDAGGVNRRAKYVTFYSGDGVYTDSLSLKQARSDHCILAFELNGSPLITEQGHPLRVIFPDMYGYKGVKWVRRLEVKSNRDLGFWEQRGWEVDAYVYNPSSFSG
jgi:DMSO/TMAO reductase YedYZ molybdopterin-dependent catalytic subunit